MPRRSQAVVRATRSAILDLSVEVASVHGLDGLAFGQIAAEVGMSKSGLAGHFASKLDWQLAVIGRAREIFRDTVIRAGHSRRTRDISLLTATCRAWLDYVETPVFVGGCFFAAVAVEFDDREGPVRAAIRIAYDDWRQYLVWLVESDEILSGEDVETDQVVFELVAAYVYLNHSLRLGAPEDSGNLARRSIERVIRRSL